MSEKVLHLGLKILSSIKHSSTGEEIEVIPEYLSMIDKKGFAWYNKSKYWEEQTQGSKLAKKRLEVLQKQFDNGIETKLYLFENVPSERCYEAKLLDYTEDINTIDASAFPDKWDLAKKSDYLLKISDLKQVDRMKTLLKLTKYDDPEISIEDFLVGFSGRNAKWLFTDRDLKKEEQDIEKEFTKKVKSSDKDLKNKIKTALNNMEKTDRPGSKSKTRNEQIWLRAHVFGTSEEMICSLCHKTRPSKIMVAAHIKKRSDCSKEERLDRNVVMPVCKVGCDELYEKGYILVNNLGMIIKNENKYISKDLEQFINQFDGLKCSHFNELTSDYFEYKFNSLA